MHHDDRGLILSTADWLGIDLSFQNFEEELLPDCRASTRP
jgi:hypothetical protein